MRRQKETEVMRSRATLTSFVRLLAWLGCAGALVLAGCQSASDRNSDEVTQSVQASGASSIVEAELPDLSAVYQARVKSGGSRHERVLCGEPSTVACADGSPVEPGDILLVRERAGDFVRASIVDARGRADEGWIKGDQIERLPLAYESGLGWEGEWVSHDNLDPRIIRFRKVGSGQTYDVDGSATYGQNDPWRVTHGGVNLGDFQGRIVVQNDGAALVEGDAESEPFNCKVKFHKLGLFLIVADNGQCGGHSVTFSGVYRASAGLGR